MADCDVCGMPLPAQRGRGGRRKRHPGCSRRKTPRIQGTFAATRAKIRVWKVEDLPLAQSAMFLAGKLEKCPVEQLAGLHRELRLALAELEAVAAPAEDDPVDRAKADLRLVQ